MTARSSLEFDEKPVIRRAAPTGVPEIARFLPTRRAD
jgi:hypothetical protein